MRLRVKNGLLHKLGLCNLPTFKLPGAGDVAPAVRYDASC